MYDLEPGVFDQIITSTPQDQPLDLEFYQYLIDGPYKLFKDRISIETWWDKPGDKKYYIRCKDLATWPANMIYNFCIATRIPVEHAEFLAPWGKLKAAGVDPGLAFLIASRIFYCDSDPDVGPDPWSWKLTDYNCPNGYHFPLDSTSLWLEWIKGEPLLERYTKNYKDNPKLVRPCNLLWGRETADFAKLVVGKTVKEISDLLGLKIGDPTAEAKAMVDAYVPIKLKGIFDDEDEVFPDPEFDDDPEEPEDELDNDF